MKSMLFLIFCFLIVRPVFSEEVLSHPSVRRASLRADRPAAAGPAFYVDSSAGTDSNPGTEAQPWKTIQASLEKLKPGDTLYLAGGTYHENLYCAVMGRPEKPITIRSKPGELAVIDGGLPEFQTHPADAWEPAPGGAADEYRSTRAYPNIRDVVGLFGDSNIGLQTYWHPEDFRSSNETASGEPEKEELGADVAWCGPGIWYNRETGHIHTRLAHTHFAHPLISNYAGETDPRKLPLVIAPFNSAPLTIDLATHVRFQDLVFRGGGLNTVSMRFGVGIEFDHVTIFGGTYGLRAKNSGPVKFLHSAIYGGIPPWGFYGENALHASSPLYSDPYTHGPGVEGRRNIARLTNHALLVMEGFEESDVFAYPFNNRWEIAWSEFADGHDGIYPNGAQIRVHDNWIGNMQDDAIYLSSPTRGVCDDVQVYRNYITGCTTAFGFHGRGGPEGSIYIYGNVVDARYLGSGRWRTASLSEVKPYGMNFFLVHGSSRMRSIESVYFYHNTAILPGDRRSAFLGATYAETRPDSVRHAANNLFVYLGGFPKIVGINATTFAGAKVWIDGNLHWSPDAEAPAGWLDVARAAGLEAESRIGSPVFRAFSESPDAVNDYRIGKGSATGGALPLPKEIRLESGVTGPDTGALQSGGEPLRVGIGGRIPVGAPAR